MASKEKTGTDNKALLPLCRMQLSLDHEQKKNDTHPSEAEQSQKKSLSLHSRLRVAVLPYDHEMSISGCVCACNQQKNSRRQKKTVSASIHVSECECASAKRGQCISISVRVCVCHWCPDTNTDRLFSKHTHMLHCTTVHLCTHTHVAFLDSLPLFRAIKTHMPTHIYLRQSSRGVKTAPECNTALSSEAQHDRG